MEDFQNFQNIINSQNQINNIDNTNIKDNIGNENLNYNDKDNLNYNDKDNLTENLTENFNNNINGNPNDNLNDNLNDEYKIKFDILKIDSLIAKNDTYEEGENKFEFCLEYKPEENSELNQNIDYQKYISKIKVDSFYYLGILTNNLKKNGHGHTHFDNGDEYFGEWEKNNKEGFGLYFFKENEKILNPPFNQIYIGDFKNNIKSGNGLYFDIKKFSEEEKSDNINKPIDFVVAIGNFHEDKFLKGIIFSIVDGKRKIYKGKIIDGKKNDIDGEIYEEDNKIFFGNIQNNIMMEGRVIILKDGEKEAAYYFKKKENDNNNDGEFEFDYNKNKEEDDIYIKKLDELNENFQYETFQDLFIDVMKIKEKCNDKDNFEYIKNLNFNMDVKQELFDRYEKFLYL